MRFVRTVSVASLAMAFKTAVFFATGKLVAAAFGVQGLGQFAQALSFSNLLITVSTGVTATGIVHYASKHRNDPAMVAELVGHAILINTILALACCAVVASAPALIAQHVFNDSTLRPVVLVLALGSLGAAFYFVVQAALNGLGIISGYGLLMISINAAALLSVTVAIAVSSERWFIAAIPAGHLCGAGIALVFALKRIPKAAFPPWRRLLSLTISRFGGFTAMALATVVSGPIAQLWIRSYLEGQTTWEGAGQWSAVQRLSDGFLAMITSTLAVYFLPKLSAARSSGERRSEARLFFTIVVPAVALLAGALYLGRHWVFALVYTPAFGIAADAYAPQIAGDLFRLVAWYCSYTLIASRNWRAYTFCECTFALLYVLLAMITVQRYGLIGVTTSYLLASIGAAALYAEFSRRTVGRQE